MKYLLPSLIVLPILEMYLLIEVGAVIGAFNTILLVFLTAVIGLALLRQQGFEVLNKARIKMNKLEVPSEEIVTGFFLAVGGAFLLTPGFITDLFGFICLMPFFRKYLLYLLNFSLLRFGVNNPPQREKKPDWIEGDFEKD